MSWNRYTLGYHGCDAALARQVVLGKEELRFSKNPYDWLGHGLYFWEKSIERAWRWARAEAERPGSSVEEPAVLGAIIDLGECLDLIDARYIRLVEEAHGELLEALRRFGQPVPRNFGKDLGARHLDCAVFEALHRYQAQLGEPPFDTVRAFFMEGEPVYENAGVRRLDHVQVRVRNPRAILGFFLPLHAALA